MEGNERGVRSECGWVGWKEGRRNGTTRGKEADRIIIRNGRLLERSRFRCRGIGDSLESCDPEQLEEGQFKLARSFRLTVNRDTHGEAAAVELKTERRG